MVKTAVVALAVASVITLAGQASAAEEDQFFVFAASEAAAVPPGYGRPANVGWWYLYGDAPVTLGEATTPQLTESLAVSVIRRRRTEVPIETPKASTEEELRRRLAPGGDPAPVEPTK